MLRRLRGTHPGRPAHARDRLPPHGGRRGATGRSREALRRLHRGRRHQSEGRPRRVLLAPRSVGLRQDHDTADDRRVRASHGRAGRPRRHRRGDRAAPQAPREHRLPELRALPPPERGEERRLRSPIQGDFEGGERRDGRSRARARPSDRLREAQAESALRRPAAAGRPRPGADPESRRALARRATGRPRRQASQSAPDRAEGDPGGGRYHVHLRDARPGGSADDVRPPRGDVERSDRTGGSTEGGLRGALHGVRRRLPRCLQPDGGDRVRTGRRWVSRPFRGLRADRGPRGARCARRGEALDPPGAGGPRGRGLQRSQQDPRAWWSGSSTWAPRCR